MACIITINNVAGVGNDGEVAISIAVSGRAEDCDSRKVIVKLFCAGVPSGFLEADVDANGNWLAVFGAPAPECECSEAVRVEAECEGNPACRAVFEGDLSCLPFEGECPDIGEIAVDISLDCNDDGTRSVTFSITITNNTGAVVLAELEFGDGDSDAFAVPDGGEHTEELPPHNYQSGASYTAVLNILWPEGCASSEVEVEVEECAAACLEADDITVEISDCKDDGTRDAVFTFPREINAELDFGDGEDVGFIGRSQTHSYRPRREPYRAVLSIEGCEKIELPVPIEPCPPWCPRPGDVTVVVGEECSSDGARDVTFIFSREITAELDFGDRSAPASFTDSSWTHAYRTVVDAEYTAVLTVEGCDPIEIPVAVLGCPICPSSDQISVEPAEECNDDGTRNVTFTFPSELTGEMDFGDGETGRFSARSLPHSYLPQADPYTAVLTTQGCDPVEVTVPVARCQEGGGGGAEGGPWICGAMPFFVAILLGATLGFTLILLTLQVCLAVPVPPWLWGAVLGLAIAVALAIASMYALCAFDICPCPTECDWLLIAWMSSLSGALIALYLWGCCLLMGIIAGGLFVTALIFFLIWLGRCHPTRCQVLDALLLVFVSVVAPFLAALAFLPPIVACGLGWVAGIVAIIGGLVGAAVVVCHAAE